VPAGAQPTRAVNWQLRLRLGEFSRHPINRQLLGPGNNELKTACPA